jgi:hypothetical protein
MSSISRFFASKYFREFSPIILEFLGINFIGVLFVRLFNRIFRIKAPFAEGIEMIISSTYKCPKCH